MPKPKKGGGRGTVVKNLWDISEVQATPPSSHVHTAPTTAATYRHPRPVRHVSATVLKHAFMLQNFQFILRQDLLTITSTQGLPQGQRKLIECIQSSDSIVPWETVHSVVMRTTIDEFKCPICMEMPTAPRITECGHVYCLPCVLRYVSRQKAASAPRTCPMCHDQLALYTLRPCVLQLVAPLQVGSTVHFDLFKRQRNSCVLRRYDDSFLTAPPPSHVAGRPPIDLPLYKEPSASQSRYVMSTPAYEAQQRYSDGAGISERMRELELDGAPQPLTQSDAEVERFLLEALNEVTKGPKALASSMVRSSPPLAPHPSTGAQAAEGDEHYVELYAEGEGQPFYLHMLTVKMLKHDAKLRGTALPDTVTGIVEEVVTMEQTEDTRHIYKVFSHVPLHGTIKLCVLNVDALLLPETRAAFAATVQRMVNERAHRRRCDDRMASEDNSWKQYLQKYSGTQRGGGGASSFSPDTAPSEFSIDTESLPYLQLPSAGSVGSDHGLPPNSLDTRQRATKRQDLQPYFADDSGGSVSGAGTGGIGGDTAAHSLLTPTTNTSSNTGGGCWAKGSAAKLFAKQERSSGVSSTWGGHAFRASP